MAWRVMRLIRVFLFSLQASTQRGKATMVQNTHLPMKTKMGIGCWWEMFPGSKSLSISQPTLLAMFFLSILSTYSSLFSHCSMFISSCKRLRIMKGSEARGLGCFL